jgi:hypothetical protein
VRNAGTSAAWEALTWSVFVHANENLRVSTWSGDTIIGSATISAETLLETGADELGISTLFQPLLNKSSSLIKQVAVRLLEKNARRVVRKYKL